MILWVILYKVKKIQSGTSNIFRSPILEINDFRNLNHFLKIPSLKLSKFLKIFRIVPKYAQKAVIFTAVSAVIKVVGLCLKFIIFHQYIWDNGPEILLHNFWWKTEVFRRPFHCTALLSTLPLEYHLT